MVTPVRGHRAARLFHATPLVASESYRAVRICDAPALARSEVRSRRPRKVLIAVPVHGLRALTSELACRFRADVPYAAIEIAAALVRAVTGDSFGARRRTLVVRSVSAARRGPRLPVECERRLFAIATATLERERVPGDGAGQDIGEDSAREDAKVAAALLARVLHTIFGVRLALRAVGRGAGSLDSGHPVAAHPAALTSTKTMTVRTRMPPS